MNKKGATVDNLYALVAFFGLAIFFVVLIVFWNVAAALNDFWSLSPIGPTIKNNAQRGIDTFDFTLVLVYCAVHLGILISVYLLRSHPIMYMVAVIILIIIPLVAAPLSNTYEAIIAESSLSGAASDIPMTNYIINKFPLFETVWSILTAIVLFGLARYEGIL